MIPRKEASGPERGTGVDVEVTRMMRAPPKAVASVMFDPDRDPEWIGGARSVERLSPEPLLAGARVRRTGGFLGKKFSWVTEVLEHVPDRLLRMRFVEGPMSGEVCYRIEPIAGGSKVSIRNRGGASFRLPGMSWMLRRSVARDLDRLADLVSR
jgi:uncharacterized protein YndB with AHSA1/START domain